MHWPRITRRRTEGSGIPRPSSSSSSDATHEDTATHPSQFHDPGLARLFSDAASFGQILTTSHPDLVGDSSVAEDSRVAQNSLNGFSQLVARDLDDNERAVSEKLARLTVSNWSAARSAALSAGVDFDGSDESASDEEHEHEHEHDKASPGGGGAAQAPEVPELEDKLTHEEILDLLQQEFGALAPPGEEKLLLESDATLFQDVVILVRPFSEIRQY